MIVVMRLTEDANIWYEPDGEGGCRMMVQQGTDVLNLPMPESVLRQQVAAANAYLDRRAVETTLRMLEAERERRRRGERPEALSVVAELRKNEAAAEATADGALMGKVG